MKSIFPKKHIRIILLTSLVLLVSAQITYPKTTAASQKKNMKSPAKVTKELNGIKEYKLPNGLKILLKESHSIPLVTFSIWYKVGSRNESKNFYGIAHFLEHMMFKGTKKYKKGEISKLIQNLGGVYNAFTSLDGTAYYETISPKHLETVIEIESDRMENSVLDQKELDLERTVVLSELEGDLNNPATYLSFKVRENAYTNSPYKHPTIGNEEDIKNINAKVMKDFYKNHYTPKNATIVLVGDFKENTALDLITKHFAKIKDTSTKAKQPIPRDKPQTKEQRVTIKKPGFSKILEIVYHISEANNSDIYPLNIIEEYLIKGEKSPLKKKLIESGLATEIYGGAEANRDPGLFQIFVSLTPKGKHKKVENIITKEIKKLTKTPIPPQELEGAKNRIKANYLFSLDGTFNRVVNLGFFELISTWEQSQLWTEKIFKVKPKDIIRVSKKYLNKDNRTVGYFIPIIPKGGKYEPTPLNVTTTHSYQEKPSKTSSQKKENTSQINFNYKKIKLKDNSTLLIYNNIDIPITYISGIIKGGTSLLKKEQEPHCHLITALLEKGSKNYPKGKIEDLLDKTGSEFSFSCNEESFKYALASTNDNLEASTDAFFDILVNPAFPKSEIKHEKRKLIAEINELKDDTNEAAIRRFNQILYEKEHPYYTNSLDKEIIGIKKADYKDIKKAHEELIQNKTSIIAIATNLEDKKLKKLINKIEDKLTKKDKKTEGIIEIPDTLLRENIKTESINIKDKYQSDVYLGHAGKVTRTHPDFYKLNIANYILGGSSLSSRLSKRVRDNAGLTYTVYSYIAASFGKGEFGIYFGSNNENVDKAIKLIKDELNTFTKNGITEKELKEAKASLVNSFVSRNLSTYNKIAKTIAAVEFYGLGKDYIKNYTSIVNSLKLDEVNQSIKKYIHPKKLNIVIAGGYKKSIAKK